MWKLAFRNLRRNRRRNLVSGLAVAFATAGLILMGSYIVRTDRYIGVNTIYVNHNGHLSIYKKGGLERYLTRPNAFNLSAEEQEKIQAVLKGFPEVEHVGRYLVGAGLASNGCESVPFLATGIDTQTDRWVRTHPQVRRWTPELVRVDRGKSLPDSGLADGVMITGRLAQILGKERVLGEGGGGNAPVVGDCAKPEIRKTLAAEPYVQLMSRTFGGDFSAVDGAIVGHHRTGLAFADETGLVASLTLLQRLYDTERVTYLSVYLKDGVDPYRFQSRLERKLAEENLDVSVYPYNDERIGVFYVGVMNFLFTIAGFFYVLALGTIAVTLTSFLTLGILERRRELGTLRAIGFEARSLRSLMLLECIVLSAAGVTCGIAVSFGVIAVVNRMGFRFRPPGIAGDMSFQLYANAPLCLGVAVVIGLLATATAWVALRKRSQEGIAELLQG